MFLCISIKTTPLLVLIVKSHLFLPVRLQALYSATLAVHFVRNSVSSWSVHLLMLLIVFYWMLSWSSVWSDWYPHSSWEHGLFTGMPLFQAVSPLYELVSSTFLQSSTMSYLSHVFLLILRIEPVM